MATIGEGHERAAQSYQDDGLLDQDILTSPTLTNFNERGLLNGVVPILLNDINDSNRNSSINYKHNKNTSNNRTTSPPALTTITKSSPSRTTTAKSIAQAATTRTASNMTTL